MSSSKQIKQAHKLVFSHQFDDALEIINDVLEDEPNNVHALLVKAVCFQRQDDHEQCIANLKHVLELDPANLPAWRGLARSYLALNSLRAYVDASIECLDLLAKGPAGMNSDAVADDARETFQRLTKTVHKLTRKNSGAGGASAGGGAANVAEDAADAVLMLQIPAISTTSAQTKRIHDLLESLSPPVIDPHALSELIYRRQRALTRKRAQITSREKSTLGYKGHKADKDKAEAFSESDLLELMPLQIDTENDDEIRKRAEAEYLDLLVARLEEVCTNKKDAPLANELRAKIKDLVDRMAMFEPVKPLAWELAFDWDLPSLDPKSYQLESDKPTKRARRKLKRSKANDKADAKADDEQVERRGSEASIASTASVASVEGQVEKLDITDNAASPEVKPLTPEEAVCRFAVVFHGTSLGRVLSSFIKEDKKSCAYNGDSVFGWLICAQANIEANSYEAAIDAAHHGLEACQQRARVFHMQEEQPKLKFKLILATAYTNYQAPKNFGLASDLYDEVLALDPENIEAMVGKGLVLSQQGRSEEATSLLEHVIELNPDDDLARAELSWLLVQSGHTEEGIEGLRQCVSIKNPPLRNAELTFRIGYAQWHSGELEQSFKSFVASLEYSKTYAPAYTYLGMFFEDVSKDKQRAHRCFYRALELDNGQLEAGERLASDFASNSQWDLVEVVATTVLSSSKIRTAARGVVWPYRSMGIVCLNQMRYDEAVKYFQRCLRSQGNNSQAWIGLGEAYINSGRYRSAEKALKRAIKLDPHNFSALYVLSLAQREMLDFPASAQSLQLAIKHAPESSVALQWALADNCLRAADYFRGESMDGDALRELELALDAVERSISAAAEEGSVGVFYGAAAEILLQFIAMGYEYAPVEDTSGLDDNKLLPISIQSKLKNLRQKTRPETNTSTDFSRLLDWAEQLALQYVEMSSKESKPRRVAAHSLAARTLSANDKLDDAVKHFQAGISLEPRNEDLWNAYGVALQLKNPMVSQHCFVRALSINGRNADTWTNLGALYLVIQDAELALEAVDRALSLEPEHPRAWIAQALAQAMSGSKSSEQIYRTLDYAYLLSSNDQLANFALALNEYTMQKPPSSASLGALTKLLAYNPTHKEANLIMGLLLELRGDYESSLTHLQKIGAWAHIARVQLALGQYSQALESAQRFQAEAADPSSYSSHADDNSSQESLSCLLTSGLAHYFLGDFDSAVESFTEALGSVSPEQEEDVLRLLVGVLYANQSPEARQVAQDQLFSSIEEHGPTLQVTLLLGAIGILEQDEVVKEAAMQELETMANSDITGEDLAQVCRVLSVLNPDDRSFQRALFQRPTDYSLWRQVDKQQALLIAEGLAEDPQELSQALVESGGLVNAQRAVFLDPLSHEAWNALAHNVQQQH